MEVMEQTCMNCGLAIHPSNAGVGGLGPHHRDHGVCTSLLRARLHAMEGAIVQARAEGREEVCDEISRYTGLALGTAQEIVQAINCARGGKEGDG